MEFCILELVKVPNFSLNCQFEFLDQIYLKRVQHKEKQSSKLQAFAFCVVNVERLILRLFLNSFKNLIILNILKEKKGSGGPLCLSIYEQPRKKGPTSVGWKLYKAFQATLSK